MNIKEMRQKQRYAANDGDLIGLYGDEKKEFRLAITLGINIIVKFKVFLGNNNHNCEYSS